MNYIKQFLILLVAVASFSACHKSSGGSALGGSDIIFINYTNSNGAGIHYRIVYGAGNNVDSIVSTGGGLDTGSNGYLIFSYGNSSYNIIDQGGNQTIVDLNSSLQIDTITTGGTTAYSYLQYYGSQLGALSYVSPITSYPYFSTSVTGYNYTNGNLTTETSGGITETYLYNTSGKGQLGDPQRLPEFLAYGRAYLSSSDLPSEMDVNGVWQEKYSYALDGSGRITRMTKIVNNTSGGFNDTLTYTYTYNF